MGFTDKLLKNKKFIEYVSEQKFDRDFYHTGSITLNLLLSGKVDGGIPEGKISMLAAPRAHFKSIIATIGAASAQKKGSIVVWVDSEFAFDKSTALMFGMDLSSKKFIHIRDNSIENCKSMIMTLFEDYDKHKDDKIFMVIDSLGTMVTSKTVDDSLAGNDKSDMTVSKKKNDFSKLMLRIAGLNNVTIIFVNHLYEDMKMHSTGAIGGGSGAQYVASSILKITSKRKEKDDNEVVGNVFTVYTDKGRFAKENSKLLFLASYKEGINPWYGILNDALEGGYVDKPTMGFYTRPCVVDDKKWRESKIYNKEFWLPVFKETDFKQYLETKYSYVDELSSTDKVYDMELGI